jgi:hypothetical protein
VIHGPLSTFHYRLPILRPGAKTSEFWLVGCIVLAALAMILLGWQAQQILKAIAAPATLAAAYAGMRTLLKRDAIKLLTELPNMTTANPANPVVAVLSDPAKYIETLLENIVKSKVPPVAAYQPQVDAVIEAGVALGWAVLERAVLAKLVAKYPQLASALTTAGIAV